MNKNGLSNQNDSEVIGEVNEQDDDLETLFNDISSALNDKSKLNKLLNAPENQNKPGQQRSATGVTTEFVDPDEGLVGKDGKVKADTDTDISDEPDEEDPEPEAEKEEQEPAEEKEEPASEKEQPDGKNDQQKVVPDKPRKPSAIKEVKKYLDTLPPDARKAVSQLMKEADKARKDAGAFKHQYESQQGRMAAIQRDVADLRTQLSLSPQPPRPPANSGAAASDTKQPASAVPALKITESARFKKLQEVDPEMAELLVEALSEQTQTLVQETTGRIEQLRASAQAAEQSRYVSRQREIVREAIPNVDEIVSTPHFREFYETSTPHVRAMAESVHSEDAFAAMQLYANWLSQRYPELVRKPAAQPAPPQPKNPADKVLEDRANRLKVAGSAAVTSSRPLPPEKEPEDEDELFKYWEKKLASR